MFQWGENDTILGMSGTLVLTYLYEESRTKTVSYEFQRPGIGVDDLNTACLCLHVADSS